MTHIANIIVSIKSYLQAVVFPRVTPALVPVRVRSHRRGAGMLEYALVALISIAVFGLLITQFSDILSTLAELIGDKLGDLPEE